MAEHQQLAAQLGLDVYFCDPRSPWQRGSNENTNRLLRQYLSKGADLRAFSMRDLDDIAESAKALYAREGFRDVGHARNY